MYETSILEYMVHIYKFLIVPCVQENSMTMSIVLLSFYEKRLVFIYIYKKKYIAL